jgi:membrane-bound metal-dependent hydrolase YbcI (DUF457 family)
MPTPVGHALGGLGVYLATRQAPLREDVTLAAACVAVSLLPDLDFAIGPFVGRSYHHYFSHSLGFTAIFGALVYALTRLLGRSKPMRDTVVLTAVYLSHILLDLVGKDTFPPIGVQLFWPVSDAFYTSNVFIFDEVWRGTFGRLFGLHNWMAVGREVLVLLPISALLLWRSRRRLARSNHFDSHGHRVSTTKAK